MRYIYFNMAIYRVGADSSFPISDNGFLFCELEAI